MAYTFHLSNSTAASNWVPLFAGAADAGGPQAQRAVQALQGSGLVREGGLATTIVTTGMAARRFSLEGEQSKQVHT